DGQHDGGRADAHRAANGRGPGRHPLEMETSRNARRGRIRNVNKGRPVRRRTTGPVASRTASATAPKTSHSDLPASGEGQGGEISASTTDGSTADGSTADSSTPDGSTAPAPVRLQLDQPRRPGGRIRDHAR